MATIGSNIVPFSADRSVRVVETTARTRNSRSHADQGNGFRGAGFRGKEFRGNGTHRTLGETGSPDTPYLGPDRRSRQDRRRNRRCADRRGNDNRQSVTQQPLATAFAAQVLGQWYAQSVRPQPPGLACQAANDTYRNGRGVRIPPGVIDETG